MQPFFLVLSFLLTAIIFGKILLKADLFSPKEFPPTFILGASYFLGAHSLLSLLLISNVVILNFMLSFFSTLAILSVVLIINRKNIVLPCKNISVWWFVFSLLLAVIFWFLEYPKPGYIAGSMDNVFSLSSDRYAYLSNYIIDCQILPIVGQNFGQSLLASFLGMFYKAPFFYLFSLKFFSVLFLSIFIYGILSSFSSNKFIVILGTLIVMLGGAAPVLTHHLVIDSGSPFGINGYSDSLFGVFSVFMIAIVYKKYSNNSSPALLAIFFIICLSMFCTAPQNCIYLFILLLVQIAFSRNRNFIWFTLFLGAGLISIPLGGMLTPKFMLSNLSHSGLMAIDAEKGLAVALGIPAYYPQNGRWISVVYEQHGIISTAKTVFKSIELLLFPLIGVIYLINLNKKQFSGTYIKTIAYVGGATLFLGFIVAFTFTMQGYKWELSRFLIPGIAIGMVGFAILVMKGLASHSWIRHKVPSFFLLVASAMAPTVFIAQSLKNNIAEISDGRRISVSEAYSAIMGVGAKSTTCPN